MTSRLGIFGLGLIGGSVALAVRRRLPGTVVAAVDSDEEVVCQALAAGIVQSASTDLAVLDDVDMVVLAAPVRANAAILPALARRCRSAVLTDAGSTKRDIMAVAGAEGCADRFVGGHPLAGGVSAGLPAARAELFEGRKWLLCADAETGPEAVERVQRFVAGLGALPLVVAAAEEHDQVMAAVSHLPQLVASALMAVAGEAAGEEGLALAGPGLADTTRLASSPPGIWRDICAANADNIAPVLDRLIETLRALRADLPAGSRLEQIFTEAAAWGQVLHSGTLRI